ncbi:MAG: hypothetical protein PHN85_05620 [Kiritimatiellae bacterium]|nr:hypothetical protein [Kiritimatiellia bacterium]
MKNSIMTALLLSAFFLAVLHSQAETTFLVTNKIGDTEYTFTNTSGTASVEDGMIVFEGELVADMPVPAALTSDNKMLASVQVVVQIKLFDELPGAEEVGAGVQGAVMALNDDPGDPGVTTGTFYAYGAGGWVQLTNSYTHLPYTTYENKTNIVTMIFDYTAAPAITYYVDIGNPEPANQVSQEITSPVTDESGINSISLAGSGAFEVDSLAATGGSIVPLSLGISLSVYYAGTGVWARVSTVGEDGHDPIRIFAVIAGKLTEVGVIYDTHGDGGDHVYTVPLGGLVPGESYLFSILDDEGHTFVMSEPLQVKVIEVGETAVETVPVMEMEMKMLAVVFNSEPGRRYQVKISESLDAAASWKVEDAVYINGGFTNEFAAAGAQTQIRIPVNKNKAFFRIIMLED